MSRFLGAWAQLLRFHLAGLAGGVTAVTATVSRGECDPMHRPLYHCQVSAAFARDGALEAQEARADLALAATWAHDRSVRTIRRQPSASLSACSI